MAYGCPQTPSQRRPGTTPSTRPLLSETREGTKGHGRTNRSMLLLFQFKGFFFDFFFFFFDGVSSGRASSSKSCGDVDR